MHAQVNPQATQLCNDAGVEAEMHLRASAPVVLCRRNMRSQFQTWFLSSPFIIRVPFFLLFGFSRGALK